MFENNVSFILPTYNEAGNIEALISEIDRWANTYVREFIVVDDNSTDGTWRLVEKMAKQDPRIRLILRTKDRGLTASLQEGIDDAKGDLVSWMDCDLSMPPEKLPEMIQEIENGYDCVIGSRYVPGGGIVYISGGADSLTGIMLSRLLNKFAQWILGNHVLDHTSGFIVIRRDILSAHRLKGDYGEYFIDLMFRLIGDGYTILEIPYICSSRKSGVSKTGSNLITYAKKGWLYLFTILRLRLMR